MAELGLDADLPEVRDWEHVAGERANGPSEPPATPVGPTFRSGEHAAASPSGLAANAGSVSVRCQPTQEFHGRIGDWVGEIRRRREQGETMLFVAATSGRAERTIEVLKEYDVLAVPVEHAEDARYAVVLVVIGRLSRGVRLPDGALSIYAEADVFEEEHRAPERRRSATKA